MSSSFASGIDQVSDPIAASQEATRVLLAIATTLLLFVAVGAVVAYVFHQGANDSAKFLATAVLTPVIGISGTVLGFYFGKPGE